MAEAAAVTAGTSVRTLMERAGAGAAEAIWRYAGPMPALVICGPGNNGGDGYVIARELRARGMPVRVAALAPPQSEAAKEACLSWAGDVEGLGGAEQAPLLIDALFGTGLKRPLDAEVAARLCSLADAARVRVAVDLPSGAATDDGMILSPVPDYDLTVTFATLKPSHLLQPGARHMGRIAIVDIGIEAESRLQEIGRPKLAAPGPDDHKYKRGYVAVVGGEMPGAGALAATAALRAGAGYVRLLAETPVAGVPLAVVQGGDQIELLGDARIGAVALGPGLGRGDKAQALLDAALKCARPLVLDADALTLLGRAPDRTAGAILTPHAGEFERLFGKGEGSKLERARQAAAASACVVLHKGADTVVAAPDGRAAIGVGASSWLASAGTGDVLTGIVAAMRAKGLEPFEAACAAVWIHSRAAALAGAGLIADDLLEQVPRAVVQCL